MPSTTYSNPTVSVAAIGGRTDSSGADVPDYTAEEARFVLEILEPGYLKPTGAWQVRAQASPNLTVRVGSGTAKADHYVVEGRVAGQGRYVVRLDAASVTLQVPAADASQPRTDQVFLVVLDNSYDATTRGLPQIGYRRGDLGGAVPGPDSAWEAYELLATIQVPAGAVAVPTGNVSDQRVPARLVSSLLDLDVDAKGDLIVGVGDNATTRLPVGPTGRVLTADSSQPAGVKWAAPFIPNGGDDVGYTSQTTGTTTWVNVNAVDPITVNVGPSGVVIGTWTVHKHPSDTDVTHVGFAGSGASTLTAGANAGMLGYSMPDYAPMTRTHVWTGLNPGSTTFRLQFSAESASYTAGVYGPFYISVVAL